MTPKALRDLILWLRSERISYSTIQVGSVTIDGVIDGKMERGNETKPKAEPRPSMFERYAGDLAKQPQAKPSEVIPEEALTD